MLTQDEITMSDLTPEERQKLAERDLKAITSDHGRRRTVRRKSRRGKKE